MLALVCKLWGNIYSLLVSSFIAATEHGYIPDLLLRPAIRFLLSKRASQALSGTTEQKTEAKAAFVRELRALPIAINTSEANDQHYEVPTAYYVKVLGPHLKYSSCLYNGPHDSLAQAEANMLRLYCKRARLADGQSILELGCGWGSLALFMAACYPKSSITAVSNSRTQKEFIMDRARERGLTNLQVVTADMVDFVPPGASTFDRVVSIEMFEHMKNYGELMSRINDWLNPGGLLFVHIFVHRSLPYHFEVKSEDDWMSKYFFTGGTMPSLDLLLYFQENLSLKRQWYIDGTHYSRTLEAWLAKHDANAGQVLKLFEETYGAGQGVVWYNRWRMFYLACSELFNYRKGDEWGLGHYLFAKRP